MQDQLTEEQKRSYENGIRIFSRWIARAYIKDLTEQKSAEKVAASVTTKEETCQLKD